MLRKRKNRRYNEETNDEEEGARKFDIHEQIRSERFDQIKEKHLQELNGDSITLKLIQKNGFEKPILVKEPHGLDLRVPPKSFHVRDVRNCVGHQRIIDVMDVKTQKNIEMSMKDWCKYYESRNRDRLLNVISLEFSHTKLDELVEAPMIVKLLDWVDLVWPKFLKESQTESTNTIDKMKYPKVQKYCLMSVKGSYTDFHIDFGGTSVWYHIIRGKKIFWMVPPTELNLQTFEEWTLSGMQQDVFFGDTVEECFRVELTAGNTFFIPSGWIHAVYTLEDSLVFGGNFLHSFGIENQLKVSKIEDATKVPLKFRYPFYTEILWYVAQHYVHCLTGKDHLHRPEIIAPINTTPEKQANDLKTAKQNSIQDDDETTESEQEECDTKRRRRVRQAKKPTKRSKKQQSDDDDEDESTEIDSANEDDIKPVEKKSANTCRMTKNSLLRLQYEIDEQNNAQQQTARQPASKQKPKSEPTNDCAAAKDGDDEQSKKQDQPAIAPSSSGNMTNLTEIMLSHDWSTNGTIGAQTTWSNQDSEQKEPLKIHITKYELNGLKVLVKHLSKLSGAKKNLPTLIRNSRALLDDCRKLIVEHENDDPELAVTGKPITREILSPKKSNINDLIEQFFKPTETTVNNGQHSPLIHSPNTSLKSMVSDVTSPHKESKCLSPIKKTAALSASSSSSLSSTSPSATTTSALPRPKSPPTRPISNNQYKTKNNNDLLLPGSFADLIAATSTEKKVFEVAPAEITSSLFGVKDTSPTKLASSPSKTSHPKDKESSVDPVKVMPSTSKPHIVQSDHNVPDKSAGFKSISPEPPKPCPQKRFINPAFRPQAKEKLIFASAPYVSPVNSSDQGRPGGLYPWQSPAPAPTQHQPNPHPPTQQQQQQQQQQQRPQNKPSDTTSSSPGVIQQAKPSLPLSVEPKLTQLPPLIKPTTTTPSQKPNQQEKPIQQKPIQQNKPTQQDKPTHNDKPIQQDLSIQCPPDQEPKTQEKTIKKPTKPRGPPKKSKEARQVLELCSHEPESTPIPTSVIKLAPAPQSLPAQKIPEVQSVSVMPTSASAPTTEPAKPKAKRKSKAKEKVEAPKPSPPPTSLPPQPMISTQAPSRMPICGLVASPMSTAGGQPKLNPQQYLISRPLLFNTMPGLSAAQFQQMPRAPMPLSMGLPHLQQGARIVWATQPRGYPAPVTSSHLPIVTHAPLNTRPPPPTHLIAPMRLPATTPSAQPDNAALLSLATTALSTAPMSTSPAMSHLDARPPASQAIMVSSAGNQPALFTNQQFLSSLVQRMPMTQFAPTSPGVRRPSGQLVFARLPNQGQPRYLITQPGFLPQRPHMPLVAGQPGPALAFATAYKPPVAADPTKAMKAKKVKTN